MTEYLLTPGPLTTAEATRRAMLRDWGSRDGDFKALTARVRDRVVALAGGTGTHSCVPIQGSGKGREGWFALGQVKLLCGHRGAAFQHFAHARDLARRVLDAVGVEHRLYEEVSPNPRDAEVAAGAALFQEGTL